MTTSGTGLLAPPMVAIRGAALDGPVPLVALLHGRGSHEAEIVGLADLLPAGPRYLAPEPSAPRKPALMG